MVVGIAGKTGAGKNRVASLLEQRGWRTLDLDVVAHQALEVLGDEIESRLGPGLLENGSISRRRLGSLVFSDPRSLEVLEKITYPWIENEARRWISDEPSVPAALHAVNLHKTSLPEDFDALIWVTAPAYVRKRRVMKRDNQSWSELKGRFHSQKSLTPKLFFHNAETYTVRNSGNDVSLGASLDRIVKELSIL